MSRNAGVTRAGDHDPMSLSESLDGVVRSIQGGTRRAAGEAQAMGGVFGRWTEIVGDAVAAHVQPVRLDGRRLVVEVSDPAWATQMRLLTDRVQQRDQRGHRHDVEHGRGPRRVAAATDRSTALGDQPDHLRSTPP